MNISKIDLTKLSIANGKLLYDDTPTSFMTSWSRVCNCCDNDISLIVEPMHRSFFNHIESILDKYGKLVSSNTLFKHTQSLPIVDAHNNRLIRMKQTNETLSYDQCAHKCKFITDMLLLDKCKVRIYFTYSCVKYTTHTDSNVVTSLPINIDMIQYRFNDTDAFPGELNPSLFGEE